MKILLIQPPVEDYYTTSIRSYPLGLLFIASNIYDICDVEILDLRQGKPKKTHSPFPYLNDIYNERVSPFSIFSKYYRFGHSVNEIEKLIAEKRPDLVGISSLFTTYFEEAIEIACIVKRIDKSILTVLGGNHPTLFPDKVMSYECVDFIIRGEGEKPFRLLIEYLQKGNPLSLSDIPGLCYRDYKKVIIKDVYTDNNGKLNLERSLLKKENYKYGKGYIAPVLTSRGCPHNCYFCGKPQVIFRKFNEDDVKKDIEKLIDLGFDTIDFEDDYFDITTLHIKNILKWLIAKNLRLTAMNGVVPKIDGESKRLIKEAGFQRVNISLVDISEEIQKEIKRGQFSHFDKILDQFIETDIPIEVHFIIGLPGQSERNLIKTITYLAEKKVLLGPSVYYLSPGSTAFNDFYKQHSNLNLKVARSSALYSVNNCFNSIKLATYLRLTRFVNYIKSIIDEAKSDMHIKELISYVGQKDMLEYEILQTLINEKKFISYNRGLKKFEEDLYETDAVLELLKNLKFIKGYKSKNICYFR